MSTTTARNPNWPRSRNRAREAPGWLLLAACALSAGAAAAALPLKTIEECIETGTKSVSLPGVAGGSLSASSCTGCASLRLKFDARTRYFVGSQAVNYTKFRQAAAKS